MFLAKSQSQTLPSRYGRCMLIAGLACLAFALIAMAQFHTDDGPLQPHIAEVDRLTDGMYSEVLASLSDGGKSYSELKILEFQEFIAGNKEAKSAFIELIIQAFSPGAALGEMDWTPGLVIAPASSSVLLEALMSEAAEGGRLEGVFLNEASVVKKTRSERRSHILDDHERGDSTWVGWGKYLWQIPDFRLYQGYLDAHSSEESAPLIEYILLRDPHQAIDILLEVYPKEFENPQAVWDDRSVVEERLWLFRQRMISGDLDPETLEAFKRLAQGPSWWTRLYCLSIVEEDPWLKHWFFREFNLTESLGADDVAIVRQVAKKYVLPEEEKLQLKQIDLQNQMRKQRWLERQGQ